MAKRRKKDFDDGYIDDDNPIGLTGAFPVIRDPQAVEYGEGDNSIGLTEAFGVVSGEEDTVHSWDRAGKWTDFDWNAPSGDEAADDGEAGASEQGAAEDEAASADSGQPAGEDAEGTAADSDTSLQGQAIETPSDSSTSAAAQDAATGASAGKRGAHGRHAAPEPELSPRMKKSKRTRKVLIVVVILLILVIGGLGYYMYQTFNTSQEQAAQQAHEQAAAPKDNITETQADDTIETASQLANVPNLASFMGKTTDEAIAELGRGAIVTANKAVKDKNSAVKTEISVALTEEPVDSKTGTPTVYLGLDKKGAIIQVGYSASASALGFGSLSFADAVSNEHVVEKTLAKIGAEIPEGSAVLPEDKAKYTQYDSDGTTVTRENCSFSGDTTVGDAACTWSAVLSYDYKSQLLSGNLSDTIRIIYVYLTKK